MRPASTPPTGLSGGAIVWSEIDERIRPLVRALNAPERGIVTLGCCCGHQLEPGYVDVAVHGLEGVRLLVDLLNRLDAAAPALLSDCALNWSDEVATACDFEGHPDWVMFSLQLGTDDDPPTTGYLAKAAKLAAAVVRS